VRLRPGRLRAMGFDPDRMRRVPEKAEEIGKPGFRSKRPACAACVLRRRQFSHSGAITPSGGYKPVDNSFASQGDPVRRASVY
jgi:hypothetical protein